MLYFIKENSQHGTKEVLDFHMFNFHMTCISVSLMLTVLTTFILQNYFSFQQQANRYLKRNYEVAACLSRVQFWESHIFIYAEMVQLFELYYFLLF